jgi:transcriptional regulator with XRE-family HTH domain
MLGRNIKLERISKGYSQGAFSKLIGTTQPYLSQIERGHKTPTVKLIEVISKELNVSVAELFKL